MNFLSKADVKLLSHACLTENRDPDARGLKPWYFVADGGIEVIAICVVVEDTMYALLGIINCAAGL